jgi:ABC-type glycerol-3-phosphate transport system substrate-binding protein
LRYRTGVRAVTVDLLVVLLVGCGGGATPPAPPDVRVWHTFGADATRLLNDDLAAIQSREKLRVAATVLPFGRARNQITRALEQHDGPSASCPDLVRIDATWLPALAQANLVRPLIDEATMLEGVTPEAVELVEWSGRRWGIPQSIEPVALIYDADRVSQAGVAWPPESLHALEQAARVLTTDERYGLSVRSDGYFFLAWLRAAGGDLATVDDPASRAALARYAALVQPGGVAPPPASGGDEARVESRRFGRREVAVLVGGPFTISELGDVPFRLAVAPFPRGPGDRPAAPRGGHAWVVPRCASEPEKAFRLAALLTAPERQVAWSREIALVPTRGTAVAQAGELAASFAATLPATLPLPRETLTPELFDDLTPAVEAVLYGDATADEALAGVARAWRRVLARQARRAP